MQQASGWEFGASLGPHFSTRQAVKVSMQYLLVVITNTTHIHERCDCSYPSDGQHVSQHTCSTIRVLIEACGICCQAHEILRALVARLDVAQLRRDPQVRLLAQLDCTPHCRTVELRSINICLCVSLDMQTGMSPSVGRTVCSISRLWHAYAFTKPWQTSRRWRSGLWTCMLSALPSKTARTSTRRQLVR